MLYRAGKLVRALLARPLILALAITALFSVPGVWLYAVTSQPAAAAPRVSWPSISLHSRMTGLSQPTSITHAGDGSHRIFVTEQPGRIRIYKNGSLLSTPFLDIGSTGANRVQTGSEQGLLSVAFPPNYAAKGYFYVAYTSRIYGPIGDDVIARYRITANPDVADPNSEQIILIIPKPEANHNGGQLQFGRDGFLYFGAGDGGGAGDQHGTIGNAQDPSQLLGKLLRINVEPVPGNPGAIPSFTAVYTAYLPIIGALAANPPVTYTIPVSNPYTSTAGFRPEIWAWGLRNPWRFSFDRANGNLYIADVGQDLYEEVDFQSASSAGGQNYGWRCYEGNNTYDFTNNARCSTPSNFVFPVTAYDHGGGRCSIIGGYVYQGPSYASMQGIYFYGDLCAKTIWGLQFDGSSWVTSTLTTAVSSISTFGEDEAGELYIAGYGNGSIYQIQSP